MIIICYLVGIIGYGISKGKQKSSEDYFLAGRNLTWPIVGISLFAANIGSSTLIGLTADAFKTNIAVYNYEWMAAVVLIIFAIFFMPFYLNSKVYTMPEFLERRYDSRARYFFSIITIVGNVIIDTAAGLYAGNLILKIIFPELDSVIIITLLAIAGAAYTIPGGLSAVVHTEVIQAIILVMGSIALTYFCLDQVGGWSGMMAGLDALNQSGQLNKSSDEVFSLVGSINDPYMPWTGLVFGVPLLGFYFWANNQFMVQRVLSARDLNHGRWGALFAGLLRLPVIFIMIVPGVIAIVLFSDTDISGLNYLIPGSTGMVVCSQLSDCPNMTYPVLIYSLLPVGILGWVIAGLLAAMSSSISATLNSASTLITMDFVLKLKPNLSSKNLVTSGQIATVILVMLAAAWAPQIEKFSSLWEYLQLVLGFIAPPVVSVFLLGLFWKRGNANGAFTSLLGGLILSIILILSKVNHWFPVINDIHFLQTVPPSQEKIENMTWTKAIFNQENQELTALVWYKNYHNLAVLLLLLTALIVDYFI
jgi:SSS family solute:Na+ symporter